MEKFNTMNNFNFLQDIEQLQNFIKILPELQDNECFILLLMARKKYLPENHPASIGNTQMIRREIVTDKSKLIRKIKELNTEKDLYLDKNAIIIPEQALAIYLTVNPRSYHKAMVEVAKTLIEHLSQGTTIRLDSMVKTALQSHFNRKIFLDIDVDIKAQDNLEELLQKIMIILDNIPVFIIKTKNGAHILLNKKHLSSQVKKTFYKDLENLSETMAGEIELKSDALVPIPGGYQGGFIPHEIYL